MRYSPSLVAVLALFATPAFAADIISCSFDMPPPRPPHDRHAPPPPPPGEPHGGPGANQDAPPPPPPGEKPAGDAPPPPPPGDKNAPPPPRGDSKDMPPPPPPPMSAPSVLAKLNCTHGDDKSQSSLKELTEKGWRLQSAVPVPGSITYYLTK